jgi:GxxExxY protein
MVDRSPACLLQRKFQTTKRTQSSALRWRFIECWATASSKLRTPRSLRIELRRRKIPFAAEVPHPIRYKGEPLDLMYRPDLICFDSIIVEVKALPGIGGAEVGQVINYLRVCGLRRGLLLNFGTRSLGFRRIVLGPKSV